MGNRDELYNDPETALRGALGGLQAQMWTALPVEVIDVDFTDNTCTLQSTIQGSIEDEFGVIEYVDLPPFIKVPICWPRGGGFALTFPLVEGDEGLVVFSSRCIDAWWQSSGVQKPMEARMHDLSDGFFIPGACSVPNALPAVSTTAVELRSDAGSQSIAMNPDGSIDVTAPAGFNVEGDLAVTGDVAITGTVEVTGGIEASLDIKAGTISPATTISLLLHTHTSATPGNPTGPPLP